VLPLLVTDDLQAPGTLLGVYWCCSASARCSAGWRSARCGSCRSGRWRLSSWSLEGSRCCRSGSTCQRPSPLQASRSADRSPRPWARAPRSAAQDSPPLVLGAVACIVLL